jgi:cell division protein FtsB
VRGIPRRVHRAVLPIAATLLVVAVLGIGVFPTRAYLAQRSDIAAAAEELHALDEANDALTERVEALGTDAEVERIAREQYNLVFPGEEAYALLPAPPPVMPVPDAWPFRGLRAALTAQG